MLIWTNKGKTLKGLAEIRALYIVVNLHHLGFKVRAAWLENWSESGFQGGRMGSPSVHQGSQSLSLSLLKHRQKNSAVITL